MTEKTKDRARALLTRMGVLSSRIQETIELSRTITTKLASIGLSAVEREELFRALREVGAQHDAMSKEHDELTEELGRELEDLVASPSTDDN